MMRSHFLATDPRSSLRTEIRYADSSNPKIVGDRVVDNYEPRYVKTDGAHFAFQNNLDMAVSLVQLNRQEHNQLMFDIKFLKDFIKELTTPKEDGKD